MRNISSSFENYISQLEILSKNIGSRHNLFLSIYENDSDDGTKDKLENFDFKKFMFSDVRILSENINKPFYSHNNLDNKVEAMAVARNKCIDQFEDVIDKIDNVLFLETDIVINKNVFDKFDSLLVHDIASPISKGILPNNKDFYDGWATRFEKEDPNIDRVRFTGVLQSKGVYSVWSTFNCFCVYNSKPFIDGVRFGHINERLGIVDCDTVVICENFRQHGYGDIILDTSISVTHLCPKKYGGIL